METDRQTHTHTHTHNDYRNPRCACALRVNQTIHTLCVPQAITLCGIMFWDFHNISLYILYQQPDGSHVTLIITSSNSPINFCSSLLFSSPSHSSNCCWNLFFVFYIMNGQQKECESKSLCHIEIWLEQSNRFPVLLNALFF